MPQWVEEGSPASPLWLVGEAPGEIEARWGRPFVGPSGRLLDQCLLEAGLNRRHCFLTNIAHERPPTRIDTHGKRIENDIDQWFASLRSAKAEGLPEHHGRYPYPPIQQGLERLTSLRVAHQPKLIVLLGGTPLWGLAAQTGITKWRGSILNLSEPCGLAIPTFHPADCLPSRSPWHRPILVADLGRATQELREPTQPPSWNFTVPTSLRSVEEWFAQVGTTATLTCDIETHDGEIACLGFASTSDTAICIPFLTPTSRYWSLDDEVSIILLLRRMLTERPICFHNGLFDTQYIARQWGFLPRYTDDTMTMQHIAFPGLLGGKIDAVTGKPEKKGSSLSLSFIASMYCHHYTFWKDDGRLFDWSADPPERLWHYNCIDCCRTFECMEYLHTLLQRNRLWDQYLFEMRCTEPTIRMMFHGLVCDQVEMQRQYNTVIAMKDERLDWLEAALGYPFNPESTPQMRSLFYGDLRLPVRLDRTTRKPSLKDHDLERIKQQNPLLGPLITAVQEYRTLDTVKDDLDVSRLSSDGRLRTTLNNAYVETMRYSSNTTAFGEGGNLQNLPRSPD